MTRRCLLPLILCLLSLLSPGCGDDGDSPPDATADLTTPDGGSSDDLVSQEDAPDSAPNEDAPPSDGPLPDGAPDISLIDTDQTDGPPADLDPSPQDAPALAERDLPGVDDTFTDDSPAHEDTPTADLIQPDVTPTGEGFGPRQAVIHHPGSTGPMPSALAIQGSRAYFVNSGDDTVGIMDLDTHESSPAWVDLPEGSNPWDLAVTLEGDSLTLYVSNLGTGTISVIDGLAGAVTATIEGLTSPEGLIAAGEYLFVADPQLDESWVPGPGEVVVIDRSTLEIVNRIGTSAPNPQSLAARGDRLYVAASGRSTWDPDTGLVAPTTDGALDIIDITPIPTPWASVALPLDPAHPLAGFPSDILLSPDGHTAWLVSGTTNELYQIDLATLAPVHGPANGLRLGPDDGANHGMRGVMRSDGLIFLSDLNAASIIVFDSLTATIGPEPYTEAFPVGPEAGTFYGPCDMALRTDGACPDLYVLLGVTGGISSIDLCLFAPDLSDLVAPGPSTGPWPTELALAPPYAYVTNGGDSTVSRLPLATGGDDPASIALPEGSSPWGLAIDEEGTTAYAAGFASGEVYRLDLTENQVIGTATGLISPEGIAVTPQWVAVADPQLDPVTFEPGQGEVVIISPEAMTVVNRIPVSVPNPQRVLVSGDTLFVLSSGTSTYDADTFAILPTGPGALSWVSLANLDTATAFDHTIELSLNPGSPSSGYPTSLAILPGGKVALLGSGTSGEIYSVDLERGMLLRGTDTPLRACAGPGVNLAVRSDSLVAAACFADDQIIMIDGKTERVSPAPFSGPIATGDSGPTSLAFGPGCPDLVGILSLTDKLFTVGACELKTNAHAVLTPPLAETGLYPNAMALWQDTLLVVNSGHSTLQTTTLDTWETDTVFAQLPEFSNPWSLAVGDDRAYVTGLLTDEVYVVDLVTGEIESTIVGFATPEGVALAGDRLLVTNVNLQGVDPGEGSVAVVDLGTMAIINTIPTTQRNPQAVVVGEDVAYVVNSGLVTFSGALTPSEAGGVDILDIATLATATAPVANIPLELSAQRPLAGFPLTMALAPDGRTAMLPSGTSAEVYVVDLREHSVLRGTDDPLVLPWARDNANEMVQIEMRDDGLAFAAGFYSNQMVVLDAVDLSVAPWPHDGLYRLGQPGSTGPQDLIFRTDGVCPDLMLLTSMSPAIAAVDLCGVEGR